MPPARMERHVERRDRPCASSSSTRSAARVQAAEIDAEVRQPVVEAERQHAVRALAHRRRRSAATERPPSPDLHGHVRRVINIFRARGRPGLPRSCGSARLRRVVAGGLLGLHLDLRVGRDQLVGDRHALDDLDALAAISASYFMSLIETKRSMRVMPSQCSTSGISCWKRASCTPATHSVRSK